MDLDDFDLHEDGLRDSLIIIVFVVTEGDQILLATANFSESCKIRAASVFCIFSVQINMDAAMDLILIIFYIVRRRLNFSITDQHPFTRKWSILAV